MDVQTAVAKAKEYVTEIFGGEQVSNVGLEEVRFDEKSRAWNVTIGFSRPWDRSVPNSMLVRVDRRTYKIVEIDDDDGSIRAVQNRPMPSEF